MVTGTRAEWMWVTSGPNVDSNNANHVSVQQDLCVLVHIHPPSVNLSFSCVRDGASVSTCNKCTHTRGSACMRGLMCVCASVQLCGCVSLVEFWVSLQTRGSQVCYSI